MSSIATTDRGVEILTRTIQPAEGNFPIEAAQSILNFRLSSTDRERVNELAAKARADPVNVKVAREATGNRAGLQFCSVQEGARRP